MQVGEQLLVVGWTLGGCLRNRAGTAGGHVLRVRVHAGGGGRRGVVEERMLAAVEVWGGGAGGRRGEGVVERWGRGEGGDVGDLFC